MTYGQIQIGIVTHVNSQSRRMELLLVMMLKLCVISVGKGRRSVSLKRSMQQTDASAIRLETCHRSSPLHPLTRSHHPIAVMIDPIDLII